MGKRIVLSVILIAAISIIVFLAIFLSRNFQSNDFTKIGLSNLNFSSIKIFNQDAIKEPKPPELSIKNISAGIGNDRTANFSIIFDVFNPNKGTLILESISYNVYSNSTRIVSGDIGQRPEGFVDSQDSIFPVIGNGTLILKDKKIIELTKNLNASQIDTNLDSTRLLVNGSYLYKQTGSFQSTGGEREFSIIYPHP